MTDVRKLLEEAYLSLDCVRQLTGTQYPVTEKIRAYLKDHELKTSQEEENHKLHQARMQWLKDQNQACNWRNS